MSKPAWMILLILTGSLALWWGFAAGVELWRYTRLATEVPAHVEKWKVVPKGSKYALQASYQYQFQGLIHQGETELGKPYHLNRGAALADIEAVKGMEWSAWVNPRHPRVSSIQKNFPLKKTFYAVILIGIFTYFCFLNWYLHLSMRE